MEVMDVLFAIFELLGTVAFAVSGAMEGVRHKMDLFGVTMLGLVTAIGGGVLRDVLAGSVPSIFRKHIYALASLAGALADVLLMRILPAEIAMLSGFGVVALIRIAAAHYKWNLPHIDLEE